MLFDAGPQQKHCFVYCGDARCNCYRAPRYAHLSDPERAGVLDRITLPLSARQTADLSTAQSKPVKPKGDRMRIGD